jgi:hypothetical protein
MRIEFNDTLSRSLFRKINSPQTAALVHLNFNDTITIKTEQTSAGDANVESAYFTVHYAPGTTQSAVLPQIVSNIVCANVSVLTDLIEAKTASPNGLIMMTDDVQMNGNLVVEGEITVNGNLFQVSIFRVTKNTTQAILDDTLTTVSFDTADLYNTDTPGTWDDGSDTFTIGREGWYNLGAAYDYGTEFPNKHLLQIFVNGSAAETLGQGHSFETGLSSQSQTNALVHLNFNDTITVKTHQTSGVVANVESAYLTIHYAPGTTRSSIIPQIVSNIVCANVMVRTDRIEAKNGSPNGTITIVDDTVLNGNLVVSGVIDSNLDLNLNNITGVNRLQVANIYGYSPVTIESDLVIQGNITASGEVSENDSGVVAGSYTSADITVNAKGRITTASSGSTTTYTRLMIADCNDVANNPGPEYNKDHDVTDGTNVALTLPAGKYLMWYQLHVVGETGGTTFSLRIKIVDDGDVLVPGSVSVHVNPVGGQPGSHDNLVRQVIVTPSTTTTYRLRIAYGIGATYATVRYAAATTGLTDPDTSSSLNAIALQ